MRLLNQGYVRYGLILVGVLVVCLLMMEATGSKSFDDKSPIFLVYQFIAPAVVWYLGLRAFKKVHHGKMSFKQGVMESLRMSLVFGIVSPFVFMVYYLAVNPGILDYVRLSYGLVGQSDWVVIGADMVVQFIASVIFGTIYGAIISFFIKNKSKK
jgi:hypothetical protein